MKRFAIIMASDDYSEPAYPRTPHCHDDARLLRDTLLEYCDYAEQDILLELLEPSTAITPADLLSRIEAVGRRSEPGDTILFFYAGHGGLFNGDTYLILPTTVAANKTQTAVPFRDISSALRLPGRLNVRVFDTCHSGQDVRAAMDYDDGSARDTDLDVAGFARAIATVTEEGWITFAACKADEYSHPDLTLRQGIFTWAFCESLKGMPAESEVHPEILKVELCKRVKDWCSSNQRTQTPTFNSAISGNVIVARRRAARLVKKVAEAPSQDVSLQLRTRLEEVRKFPRVGSKEHTDKLANLIATAKTSLEARIESVDSFGCKTSIVGPGYAQSIPNELHRRIVEFVSSSAFRPLHEIERREVRDERSPNMHDRIMGNFEPIVTKRTEYVVSQSHPWPLSQVTLTIESDGCVPGVLLFLYLVPLQLRAALIAGISLSREDNFASDKWSMKKMGHTLFDLGTDEPPRVELFVAQWIESLNGLLRASVMSRLAVLEQEIGLKP